MPPQPRNLYLAVKTNMLYDALLVPNIGVELYLGKDWSVGANWMYAWWKTDRRHWYWRTYGGDIAIRKWFGKAPRKSLLPDIMWDFTGRFLLMILKQGEKAIWVENPEEHFGTK